MITIDKYINENILYATLSEMATTTNPTYTLELFNFYTNVTYHFPIYGSTYSNTRYDLVTVNLDEEVDGKTIVEGEYKYIFYEVIGLTGSREVETGYALVNNSGNIDSDVVITPDETDDDYITYTG